MPDHTPDQLDDLLTRYLDGELSPEETARLNALLREDAAARDALAEVALYGRLLRESMQPQRADVVGAISACGAEPTAGARPTYARLAVAAGFAIAATVALVAALLLSRPGATDEPAQAAPPVAVLLDAVDVAWNTVPMRIGEPIAPGELSIGSGTVEIQFHGGASVVIDGPARLEVVSEAQTRLHAGTLLARLGSGASFQVDTPGARVIDLGTEFEVSVDDTGDSSVRVLSGRVELTVFDPAGGPGQSFEMTGGSAARVVGGRAIIGGQDAAPLARRAAAYRSAVLADAPLAYFPLDEAPDAERVADASGNGYDAAPSAVAFGVPGPLGTTAAEFTGRSIVDAGLQPDFAFVNDFTVEAWVWIDPGFKALGAIATAINPQNQDVKGGWVFGYDAASAERPHTRLLLGNQRAGTAAANDPPITPQRWTHVAVTHDPSNVTRLYVDGVLVQTSRNAGPALADRTALTIGRYGAGYGGWIGRLAHVAIYDRTLDEARIAAHANIGKER